tara:strand:- start:934 stop:1875 length:942 start_codon:yes stop_codon:yes gene_type:complete
MAAWIDNTIEFLKKIESNNYMWTLNGYSNAKLSAASLFSKCAKIFQNYHTFKISPLNNIILRFRHPEIGFYIDKTSSRDDIIAESRQALSALYNNNGKNLPPVNMSVFYTNPRDLYFMKDMIWNNPWNAGAQLSHYLFFLKSQNNEELIEMVLRELERYQKPDGWYFSRPADHVRINGIMKIFTGLDIIEYDYSKLSDIIHNITDSMIDKNPESGGCNIYDFVYVLSKAIKIGYRVEECRDKLMDIYTIILDYQHKDGGFSYNKDSTTKHMYGKLITKGKACGGMHGTTLMCMALTYINEACELGLNLNIPVS